jgi:hypothetical protein
LPPDRKIIELEVAKINSSVPGEALAKAASGLVIEISSLKVIFPFPEVVSIFREAPVYPPEI